MKQPDPPPSFRSSALRIFGLLLLTLAGACTVLIDNELGSKPGSGGGTATGASGGAGTTGGGGAGAEGGGGMAACTEASDCPGSDGDCRWRTCEAGTCGTEDAAAGAPCDEGTGAVCDGNGSCVECLDASQCMGDELCAMGSCVPPSCRDGVQNGDETDQDCGGSCPPCDDGEVCLDGVDCTSGFCDATSVGTGGAGGSLGGAGGIAGNGGSGGGNVTPGVCAACSDDADCGPYACQSGDCAQSCSGPSDCATDAWCDGMACNFTLPLGQTCTAAIECQSGFCADGTCCDAACQGACEACDLASLEGSCTTFALGDPGSPSCSPLVCDGVSGFCPNGCSVDGDCIATHFCDGNGSCQPKQANGTTCTGGGECQAGLCVDGYCCNSACTGGCNACDFMGSEGTCSVIPPGSAGSDPSCAPYLCDGVSGFCPNGCTINTDCIQGTYCDANNLCVPKKNEGQGCGSAAECASGHCVDGFCCDSGCGGACDACDVNGSIGTCSPLPDATVGDPLCTPYLCDGTNAACPTACVTGADCAIGFFCNALSQCTPKQGNGLSCTTALECLSGFCADGVCCTTACGSACDACNLAGSEGTCSPVADGSPGVPSCDPYLCNGINAGCPITCLSNADCTAGSFCDATGQCTTLKADGDSCAQDGECQSGSCVDDFCCDTACTDSCEACNLSGSEGTCSAVAAGNPGDPICTPYLCDGNDASCPTSCGSDADCDALNYCGGSSTCQPKLSNGQTCIGGNECLSGNCVDGVCCNSACGGSCEACDLSGFEGACTLLAAGATGTPTCEPHLCDGSSGSCPTTCSANADCSSDAYCEGNDCQLKKPVGDACGGNDECQNGTCVDGYCCDSTCGDPCDACNVPGNLGSCTVVGSGAAGDPSCTPYVCDGSSSACPTSCGNNNDCSAGNTCDGSNQCVGLLANGGSCTLASQCQSGNCVDGVCCDTLCAGDCDACNLPGLEGTCTVVADGTASGSCTPYLCDGASASCPATCAGDEDCIAGHFCDGGVCTLKEPDGTVCTANDECQSGFCADGFCCNSACEDGCNACDLAGAEGVCSVTPAGDPGDPVCSPYVCDGMFQTCPTSCTSNGDCATGFGCDGGTCKPKKTDGQTCQNPNQCASGFCVDGVCCDTACDGACGACDLNGTEGVCTAFADGDIGDPSCSPYLCDGSNITCPTSCAATSDCVASHYCDGTGTCAPDQGNGASCAAGHECQSGFCPTDDGVCCAEACDGTCESCLASKTGGTDGLCSFVEFAEDPDDECGNQLCDSGSCACGLEQVPPGGSCPSACTSCNGALCIIDCSVTGACNGANVNCPAGFACEVKCNGDRTCQNKSVNCPDDFACAVECKCSGNDSQCCQNANINCSTEGLCDLQCGNGQNACQSAVLSCGENACSASCTGSGSTPTVQCNNSCACSNGC